MAVTPSSASAARCAIAASNVPSARERPDVQLVEDESSSATPRQPASRPGEACRGRRPRDGPAQALGLPARGRVGPRACRPARARSGRRGRPAGWRPRTPKPSSVSGWSLPARRHGDVLGRGRPDAEGHPAGAGGVRSEGLLPGVGDGGMAPSPTRRRDRPNSRWRKARSPALVRSSARRHDRAPRRRPARGARAAGRRRAARPRAPYGRGT